MHKKTRPDLKIIEALTKHIENTNPHASYQFGNYTPLHIAAKEGELDTVQFLVKKSYANPTEKSQPGLFGKTPYEIALWNKRDLVAKYLEDFLEPKVKLPDDKKCDKMKNGFLCKNGDCVNSELICDGRPSLCVDGSDKEYCENNFACKQPKYQKCPGDFNECFIPDLKITGNLNLTYLIMQ